MNDYQPNLIGLEETGNKSQFPIVAQLGILSLVFVGLFGSYAWNKISAPPVEPEEQQVFSTDKKEYPIIPQKIEKVSVEAQAVFVWDVREKRELFSKNADEQLPLASITKLMTALLAHELIEENTTVSITDSAIKQDGSSGLSPGEKLKVTELLELTLVSSSNDAAYALGASVGQLLGNDDPMSQFVRGMNIRAAELGLSSLDFKNTTGLDLTASVPGAVGSARDISILMDYIVTKYPEIIEPTQLTKTRIYNATGAYHEAENTNEVAAKIPSMIGSKTGYTDLAGGNLTVAFDAGLNRPIIITVLGSTREGRFEDVLTLISAVQESLSEQ